MNLSSIVMLIAATQRTPLALIQDMDNNDNDNDNDNDNGNNNKFLLRDNELNLDLLLFTLLEPV